MTVTKKKTDVTVFVYKTVSFDFLVLTNPRRSTAVSF